VGEIDAEVDRRSLAISHYLLPTLSIEESKKSGRESQAMQVDDVVPIKILMIGYQKPK